MALKTGHFYIIRDNINYKANKFIGEILKECEDNTFLLNIYIFPEDTKDGRQEHMSSNEVFLTPSQILLKFDKNWKTEVEVVSLINYINRKYINKEKLKFPLYFQRQTYSLEKNLFYPTVLPLNCFCNQIFNPDYSFKLCDCGKFYHTSCIIQANPSICLIKECKNNLNNYLNEQEQIQKAKMLSKNIEEDFFGLKLSKSNSSDMNLLKKKKYREKNEEEIEKEMENDNTKKKSIKFNDEKSKLDLNIPKKEKARSIEIIGEKKSNEFKINKEKGADIIYNILKEGLNYIKINLNILEKYKNCKNKEIYNLIKSGEDLIASLKLRNLSEKIVDNLYILYCNKPSSFYNYLQEFNKCKKNSIDLIIKIILEEYSPEEISQFKENDFLSDEQKKENEEKKKNEINKMRFKSDENEVKLIINKGRMLSEKEIYNEDRNEDNLFISNENSNVEILENNKIKEYNEKIKEKKKQFPNMNIDEIKMLIDLKELNSQYIDDKLNKLIQDNFDIEEQDYFFEKRKIILEKEAKKILKKNKKNNENNNNNNGNLETIEKKIRDISFEIQFNLNSLYEIK